MAYPIIRRADARTYLVSEQKGESIPLPEVGTRPEGNEVDWESIAEDLNADLLALAEKHKNERGRLREFEFEAAAPEIVHSSLPSHPALADGEFWTWLALVHFRDLIKMRYPGSVNVKNFGVGSAQENFLYRQWMRADLVFDEASDEPYRLSRRGKVDFWRSHVFRQRYTNVQQITKALIRFQFPNESESEPRLNTTQIREFAKHLKRARSNLTFELMSESRAAMFVETEGNRVTV